MSRFLVVSDNARVRRAVRGALASLAGVRAEPPSRVTSELVQAGEWAGFVLGSDIPPGRELEIVEWIQAALPMAPVVILLDPLGVSVALDARTGPPWVDYVRQPLVAEELLRLVRDAVRRRELAREVVDLLVWAGARTHGFTDAEAEIVRLRHLGFDGPAIAARRGVSKNTHKTETKGILRKCGCNSLTEFCDQQRRRLLRAN